MGIDLLELKLIKYVNDKYGNLGRTITLGRQAIHLGPRLAKKILENVNSLFCESLLENRFGATKVDSIDNSNYEGASITWDLNHPIDSTLEGYYNTVLDFGCSEHIFDIAQAIKNIAKLCKVGGLIIHSVPANQSCGHGFYQFSPEFFFSLYNKDNGFSDTEVFLVERHAPSNWFRVDPPKDGFRVNVRSSEELYLLIITKRAQNKEITMQQSDYKLMWDNGTSGPINLAERKFGRLSIFRELMQKNRVFSYLIRRLDSILKIDGARSLRRHPSLSLYKKNDFN
ncbi:hypothetical protein ACCI51_08695 [Microbulbifer echini]|uniref:Methyltransferase domain-containing protein n=1 Tax=Microbulbifer echini TaxID=1529067 RepID=A0ABV4NMR3_9GAMM